MFLKEKKKTLRARIGDVIFGNETFASKLFDVVLIILILLSSFVVIIETVPAVRSIHGGSLMFIEWIVLSLFTIEYGLRIYSAKSRVRYIFSLYGIIDFLAIFPAYLSIFFPPLYYLTLFRTFRVFRIFRILKLLYFLEEETVLVKAIKRSLPKIIIFLSFILVISTIFASAMYIVEGPENGFVDIPTSLYWTIVTITTVGYGDLTPLTSIGKILASLIMVCGYGIIAVPTGIVVSEYNKASFLKKK
ncbi:MAG: ion transporter [Patescibacteria group bacterium]